LGAMTFSKEAGGNQWGLPVCNEKDSHQILDEFATLGGNFIDTADVYTKVGVDGDSEKVVGNWLKTKTREDFVIATKVRFRTGDGVNNCGLSRLHILVNVEKSLKNLQTSYIDLYQIHSWDAETPLKETLITLNDLVRSGKVRYIGVSNILPTQLQKAIDLSRHIGIEEFVCLQPQYNLLCRSPEWDLIPVAIEEGLGVIPWSPLAGGLLSGKYSRNSIKAEEGSRIAWSEKFGWKATSLSAHASEKMSTILDKLHSVAKETGRSPAQVALRWLLQKPGVTAPIIGARKIEQLRDNMAASTFQLTPEQMKKLDEASSEDPPYPYGQSWIHDREMRPVYRVQPRQKTTFLS